MGFFLSSDLIYVRNIQALSIVVKSKTEKWERGGKNCSGQMFISGLPFMTDCCLLLACHLNDGENTLEDVGKFHSIFY